MKNNYLKIVIMAGGRGERFWPKSRRRSPKQFAPIISNNSMLVDTVSRFKDFVPLSQIFISTGTSYKEKVIELLPDLPIKNIICEPVGRDTAACIYLSVAEIPGDKDDVFFFIPADHYIGDLDSYFADIVRGTDLALQSDAVVLLGIKPHSPSQVYGYLKCGEQEGDSMVVESFLEKPDLDTANSFLSDGHYLWNSGMFFFSRETIVDLYKKYALEHCSLVDQYLKVCDESEKEALDIFSQIPRISFDYAIMENAPKVRVIVANFVWDDVGSWAAVSRVNECDSNNNLLPENAIAYKSTGVICQSDDPEKVVVLNGLTDINLIINDDVIYLCQKDSENDIKTILKDIEKINPGIL